MNPFTIEMPVSYARRHRRYNLLKLALKHCRVKFDLLSFIDICLNLSNYSFPNLSLSRFTLMSTQQLCYRSERERTPNADRDHIY